MFPDSWCGSRDFGLERAERAVFDHVAFWSRPADRLNACVAELKSEPELSTAEMIHLTSC